MTLAVDGRAVALLAVADRVEGGMPGAFAALRDAGLRIVLATGDDPTTAQAVARMPASRWAPAPTSRWKARR